MKLTTWFQIIVDIGIPALTVIYSASATVEVQSKLAGATNVEQRLVVVVMSLRAGTVMPIFCGSGGAEPERNTHV
jgi:hypothetical protein